MLTLQLLCSEKRISVWLRQWASGYSMRSRNVFLCSPHHPLFPVHQALLMYLVLLHLQTFWLQLHDIMSCTHLLSDRSSLFEKGSGWGEDTFSHKGHWALKWGALVIVQQSIFFEIISKPLTFPNSITSYWSALITPCGICMFPVDVEVTLTVEKWASKSSSFTFFL